MAHRRTDAEIERENQNVVVATIVVVVILFAAFFLSPGMMLVAFCVRPFVALDLGQMWIFSVVGCVVTIAALRVACGSWSIASRYYIVACLGAIGAFVLAKFGFHAQWPDLMWDEFTRAGGL